MGQRRPDRPAGNLPLERLVRHYRPDQLNEAAEDMHRGKTVKPVVRFDTG